MENKDIEYLPLREIELKEKAFDLEKARFEHQVELDAEILQLNKERYVAEQEEKGVLKKKEVIFNKEEANYRGDLALSTRITIESVYGKYSAEINRVDLTFEEFLEEALRPVLLAYGYVPSTIDSFFGETA